MLQLSTYHSHFHFFTHVTHWDPVSRVYILVSSLDSCVLHILRHLKEMNHLWNINVFDNLIEIFKMVASMIARMYVGR